MAKSRPSAPPVSQELRLASSPSISDTPSVTISRVRSVPRSTSGAVTRPASPATRLATSRPSVGSARPRLAEDPRRVGAEAEERGVTERDEAGVAEREVERQREQAEDEDFVDQQRARGHEQDQRQRRRPGDDFQRPPASSPQQMARDKRRLGRSAPAHTPLLANRPCGRINSVATITA